MEEKTDSIDINRKERKRRLPVIRDKLDFIDVPMNHWGVTTGKRKNYVLATRGLGGCTTVAFWDPDSKAAGLVHIRADKYPEGGWSSVDRDILSPYLVMQRYGVPSSVEKRNRVKACVIGGEVEGRGNIIGDRLKKLGFERVEYIDNVDALTLDARNGAIRQLTSLIPRPFINSDERELFAFKAQLGDAKKTPDKRSLS